MARKGKLGRTGMGESASAGIVSENAMKYFIVIPGFFVGCVLGAIVFVSFPTVTGPDSICGGLLGTVVAVLWASNSPDRKRG